MSFWAQLLESLIQGLAGAYFDDIVAWFNTRAGVLVGISVLMLLAAGALYAIGRALGWW